MKITQDRKISYVGLKRTHKEFVVGYYVYLKVRPNIRSLNLDNVPSFLPSFVDCFRYWTELDQ